MKGMGTMYKYESQKRATQKYKKNHTEHYGIDLPKGTRDIWKSYAESKGVSLANLIKTMMNEAMEADGFSYEIPEESSAENKSPELDSEI